VSDRQQISRRRFLARGAAAAGSAVILPSMPLGALAQPCTTGASGRQIQLGLCTYQWGRDWDLPTLLANCQKAKVFGVELRTEHKHGVEPNLEPQQRREVKQRFADSPVTLVGLGTNQCFDSPDAEVLNRSIEGAKVFLQLSHDCGSSGVKVKPNDFHQGVSRQKTIEQIGRSLNLLGKFAADLGQQVRLEVHGSCREPLTIAKIMEIADHPSVGVCWNCNADMDLAGKGLEHNFNLVCKRFGETLHIHELSSSAYPYRQLFDLLKKRNYSGWALLECSSSPKDRVAAMAGQRSLFDRLVAL
jgi:hypothetical protein